MIFYFFFCIYDLAIKLLSNEDERSPGLIQFLRDSLAQKMGQRVPTKIIQDQNGDVQGQVHKHALSGRSFLDVGPGQPQGLPGPGSVYVAIDMGNPDNNRILMTEAEAAAHLDKSLKKRKVNINKVKTNLVPNLPQENFLQNIRSEINRIAQENPNILNQANPNFIESLRLRFFDQLIVQQNIVDNNIFTVNIDEETISLSL